MTSNEIFSTFLAAGSVLGTVVLWAVKSRGERPRLTANWLDVSNIQIKNHAKPGLRWVGLPLQVAVTNLSDRPDILRDVSAEVRLRDGSWRGQPSAPDIHIGSNTALPIRLASLASVPFQVWGWVEMPTFPAGEEMRFGHQHCAYVARHLTPTWQARVRLRGLDDKPFVVETPYFGTI